MEDEEDVDFAVRPEEEDEDTGGAFGDVGGVLQGLSGELTRSREQAIRSRKALWDGYAEALRARRTGELDKTDRIINALQTFGKPRRGGVWHDLAAMNEQVVTDTRSNRKASREREDAIREAELRGEMDLASLAEKYDLKGIDLYGTLAKTMVTAGKPKVGVLPGTDTHGPMAYSQDPRTGEATVRPIQGGAAGGTGAPGVSTPGSASAAPGAPGPGGPPGSTYVGPDGATYMNLYGKAPVKISDMPPAEKARIEAETKILTEASANAKVKLPDALLAARTALKGIEELNAHPGLSALVGVPNPLGGNLGPIGIIPGSPAAGAKARLDQLTAGAFMAAREALKGAGQVTDYEGKRAEAAIARMSTATSEAEFRTALADFRQAIRDGLTKMKALADGTYRPDMSAPPSGLDLNKFFKR
jgi:hypothetical protein